MMDERDRLRSLIDYVKVLSNLQGNYHNEIKIAIAAIEKELGISRAYRDEVIINVDGLVSPKNHFTK